MDEKGLVCGLDFDTGILTNYTDKIERRLKDMKGFFLDEEGADEEVLIYEVFAVSAPKEEGQLSYATTIIYPGKIGQEFFMTKGHYHRKEGAAEVYVCLGGKGILLIQTKDGKVSHIEMEKGTVGYVPPHHAHRTVNVGKDNFVFLAVYPSDAGHDYGEIEEKGFSKIVVEEDSVVDGGVKIKDRPKD